MHEQIQGSGGCKEESLARLPFLSLPTGERCLSTTYYSSRNPETFREESTFWIISQNKKSYQNYFPTSDYFQFLQSCKILTFATYSRGGEKPSQMGKAHYENGKNTHDLWRIFKSCFFNTCGCVCVCVHMYRESGSDLAPKRLWGDDPH